jgi:hypothetical protein
MLILAAGLAALAVACADKSPTSDDPSATSTATGDSAATASLSREQLEPLMVNAQLEPSDLPGTWKMTDLGMFQGDALAMSGGQQTQIGQAVIDACLAPQLEGGGEMQADSGVIRAFVSDSILGSVISTVSRRGDGAARTVAALRQPVTDEMKTCVEGEVLKSFGGTPPGGSLSVGELRSVTDLPDGSAANVVTMTLGSDGSAITQQIVTAGVARDGLLATAVEVTISGGNAAPNPPLAPERLVEVATMRLEEALAAPR